MRSLPKMHVASAASMGVVVATTSALLMAQSAAAQTIANTRTGIVTPVTLRISRTGVLSGPHSMRGGAAGFRIRGVYGRRVLLFKARQRQSASRLASDLNVFSATGRPTRLLNDFIPASGANAGHTVFVTLVPGHYFAVVPHLANLTAKTVFPIAVVGPRSTRTSPAPTAIFRPARGGLSWAAVPRSLAPAGILELNNASRTVHELVLARMRSGVTLTTLKSALSSGLSLRPYLFSNGRVHIGAIGAGHSAAVPYSVQPGQYAAIDFWPNAAGRSHSDLGMVRTITVR